jgi:hypothetical protein
VTKQNDTQLRLAVGDSIIGLNCLATDFKTVTEEYFGFPSSPKEPDIILNLNIVFDDKPIIIPDSLYMKKTISGDCFTIADDLIRGYFNTETRSGELWVKSGILRGRLARVFEQILYQAYYSIRKIRQLDTFLIHSSGVIHNDFGYLFVGAPGAGKSTVAELSKQYKILNDEIVLVSFTDDGIFIHGTPFNGFFHEKTEGTARLKAVYLLEHGPSHQVIDINPSDAILILMSQIVPPLGLEDVMTNKIKLEMLNIAEKLEKSVPVRRLSFTPDIKFWDEIKKYENK